jgi:hypothetical protein
MLLSSTINALKDDINKNGTRFVGNQLGYKSEIGKTGLNEEGLFEIIF